jgi:hypothetical protein
VTGTFTTFNFVESFSFTMIWYSNGMWLFCVATPRPMPGAKLVEAILENGCGKMCLGVNVCRAAVVFLRAPNGRTADIRVQHNSF